MRDVRRWNGEVGYAISCGCYVPWKVVRVTVIIVKLWKSGFGEKYCRGTGNECGGSKDVFSSNLLFLLNWKHLMLWVWDI